jgi:hypothetical protein
MLRQQEHQRPKPLRTCSKDAASQQKPPNFGAPPLFLDFLYPRGALSLMRKLAVTNQNGRLLATRQAAAKRSSRSYTASMDQRKVAKTDKATAETIAATTKLRTLQLGGTQSKSFAGLDMNFGDPVIYGELSEAPSAASEDKWDDPRPVVELRKILQVETPERSAKQFDRAWELYTSMREEAQRAFTGDLLSLLERSDRPEDQQRASVMRHPSAKAAEDALDATGRFYLKEVSRLEKTIKLDGSSKGIGRLLLYALKLRQFDMLNRICRMYVEAGQPTVAQKDVEILVQETTDLDKYLVELCEGLERAVIEQSPRAVFSSPQPHRRTIAPSKRYEDTRIEMTVVSPRGPKEGWSPRNPGSQLLEALLSQLSSVLKPKTALLLLRSVGNPVLYEVYISHWAAVKEKRAVVEAYKFYRMLPGVKIRGWVMKLMVERVLTTQDVEEWTMVRRDFYGRYSALEVVTYHKFLAFYAARGDVNSVYQTWNELMTQHPGVGLEFNHVLNVYTVRGELDQVERVFDEISDVHGLKPRLSDWNIRLHAHVNTEDLDDSMDIFKQLCEAVEPDAYSFGTIMSLSGARGDVALTLELYQMAKDRGVAVNAIILNCVVEAYCKVDSILFATRLCIETTKAGKVPGDYTIIWNTILRYYAQRYDMAGLDANLQIMSKLGVAYSSGTYTELLLALLLCNQPIRAYDMFKAAIGHGLLNPTPRQYFLIMALFARQGHLLALRAMHRRMTSTGFLKSGHHLLTVMKALSRAYTSTKGRFTAQQRLELLNKALRVFNRGLARDKEPWLAHQLDITSKGVRQRQFAVMLELFTQANDTATFDELLVLYENVLGGSISMNSPRGLSFLVTLMRHDLKQGRHERVLSTWELLFSRMQQMARSRSRLREWVTSDGKPNNSPAQAALASLVHVNDRKRQDQGGVRSNLGDEVIQDTPHAESRVVGELRTQLSEAVDVMLRLHLEVRDPVGLKALMARVLRAGFVLQSRTWNLYVQSLAALGLLVDAFLECEERLLGGWRGWASRRRERRIPRFIRWSGRWLFNLRPDQHTLLYLRKTYREAAMRATLSRADEHVLSEIRTRCPGTIRAILSLRKSTLREHGQIITEGLWKPGGPPATVLARLQATYARRSPDAVQGSLEDAEWSLLGFEGDPSAKQPGRAPITDESDAVASAKASDELEDTAVDEYGVPEPVMSDDGDFATDDDGSDGWDKYSNVKQK